ncbi:MAG: Patatin-like phospholipase [Smithella sp. PtaU1.Bin162]|nr:MAG: Patatin-like phospholipase [Smithella sp. PtaU1.Bin162]
MELKKIIMGCRTFRYKFAIHICGFLSLLVLSSCAAQYPLNTKIEITEGSGAPYDEPAQNDHSDLVLILAFSGGGTRAASLAYGTLEALKQVELPEQTVSSPLGEKPRTMLNQISAITAVSGGSFTAAYYGIHGEGIFKDFKERCLLKDIQGDLLRKLFNPFNWPRLSSPRFGRSDLAQEYYDEILFKGATLADMIGKDRPSIVILATDAIEGVGFPFIPDTFKWICSDFSRFPVARAVTASSAVPGAFSPVVLKNYVESCKTEAPAWMQNALENPDPSSRTYHMAVRVSSYLDQRKKPFIYLVDGGISDNLGLRTIIDTVTLRGGLRDSLAKAERKGTRRIAFIIVDAETEEKASWGFLGEVPGIGAILGASSTIMINKYNFETLDLLHRSIRAWQIEEAESTSPLDFYLIHLNFNFLPEKAERDYFHGIPTTLTLPEDQVDRLRSVAAKLLYTSPDFQRLVHDMGGKILTPRKQSSGKVDSHYGLNE